MEIKPYLRRPQFYETDGMSIIWHGNYVRWMEEARTDFMDQLGFPYARAVEAGIDFALTDISCKYRAMTRSARSWPSRYSSVACPRPSWSWATRCGRRPPGS